MVPGRGVRLGSHFHFRELVTTWEVQQNGRSRLGRLNYDAADTADDSTATL